MGGQRVIAKELTKYDLQQLLYALLLNNFSKKKLPIT